MPTGHKPVLVSKHAVDSAFVSFDFFADVSAIPGDDVAPVASCEERVANACLGKNGLCGRLPSYSLLAFDFAASEGEEGDFLDTSGNHSVASSVEAKRKDLGSGTLAVCDRSEGFTLLGRCLPVVDSHHLVIVHGCCSQVLAVW